MPHRDPETGQFVASENDPFDDVEVVSFSGGAGLEAAQLDGGTGFAGGTNAQFEGLELLDYDEIVDRNETLHLLSAYHGLSVFANSTETADGTVAAGAEVSASPSSNLGSQLIITGANNNIGDSSVVGGASTDDSIDLIGRPLMATGTGPFSDSASGVGGAGSAGSDAIEVEDLPPQVAEFHPRDELFLNGEFNVWNIDDAGVHLNVNGQHVYGVISD